VASRDYARTVEFTKYGKTLAANETVPAPHPLGGATAHMHACQHDAGIKVRMTGHTSEGKRFTREAKSVYGAYATFQAMWGLDRAWHVLPDGSRNLIFRR
jgi:hypothetical protein